MSFQQGGRHSRLRRRHSSSGNGEDKTFLTSRIGVAPIARTQCIGLGPAPSRGARGRRRPSPPLGRRPRPRRLLRRPVRCRALSGRSSVCTWTSSPRFTSLSPPVVLQQAWRRRRRRKTRPPPAAVQDNISPREKAGLDAESSQCVGSNFNLSILVSIRLS
ncbi:hypothetical protein CDD83_5130 [Cordyceps sp. RAO-2017]|nr:hypothetical protein CDD83_5130 [Cordyceps sp. RAO-2017]